METAIAFAIFMMVVGLIASHSSDKKAAKAAKAEQDSLAKYRSETREIVRNRAMKDFKVEYTEDELDWICDVAETQNGKEGLSQIRNVFETCPRDKLESFMMLIEEEHFKYILDQRDEEHSNELERNWQNILEDFKKLNPAQRKVHLDYLKKNYSDTLTDEQLHILELACLSDQER